MKTDVLRCKNACDLSSCRYNHSAHHVHHHHRSVVLHASGNHQLCLSERPSGTVRLLGTRWRQCLVPHQPVGHVRAEVMLLFQRSDSHQGLRLWNNRADSKPLTFTGEILRIFTVDVKDGFFVVYWTEFARC